MILRIENLHFGCFAVYDVQAGDVSLTLYRDGLKPAVVVSGYRIDVGQDDPTAKLRNHKVVMNELELSKHLNKIQEILENLLKNENMKDKEVIVGVRPNFKTAGILIRKQFQNPLNDNR